MYPNIFSTIRSHKAPSQVMVVDGLTHNIVGFGTIKATSSIAMSSVLNARLYSKLES